MMKLHFVENMDEVLRIALVSEPKPLPAPPVHMEQGTAEENRAH
jgi:hypothetical protein